MPESERLVKGVTDEKMLRGMKAFDGMQPL